MLRRRCSSLVAALPRPDRPRCTGQTLGKRLRKVRLVRVDGQPVGWGGVARPLRRPDRRHARAARSSARSALIVGARHASLWILRDRNRQGVHDKLAKTLVVEA